MLSQLKCVDKCFLQQNFVEMSPQQSAQFAGPDTFARRYLSPTQWDFYGLGVTHQNTFTGSSVQHLLSVYCHFWPRRDATKVVAVVVVMLL